MQDYALENRTVGHILAEKAGRVGDRVFLKWRDQQLTYADLDAWTNRYAHGFRRLGIRQGEHVAVMMSNCPEFFWVIWGLAKIGAVVVPVNVAAKGELLAYFIRQSDSIAVVMGAEWAERVGEVAAELAGVRLFVALGEVADPRMHRLDAFAAEPADPPRLEQRVRHSDPQFIMYTSGTTGPSKGVVSPHAQAHAVGRHLTQQFGYGPEDVLYTCLPTFHGNALWYTCFAALWADAAIALAPRFSVSQFWGDIQRFGATQFNALGAMTNLLLQLPPHAAEREHKVRQIMVLPLTPDTWRALSSRFGVRVTSVYAMTETFPVTVFRPDDPAEKGSSAGKARGLADIAIMDEDDRKLPPGAVGEICVRPTEPWIMTTGYYKQAEATVREFRNMWFHSGDRGSLDADGWLTFADRKKEAIRRRGENFSAFELEMLISRHPEVIEVAAVPIAAELGEDEVMVYVVPRTGCAPTPEGIVRYCDGIMPYYMVPRFVEVIDALPKTASEKIEKYKLKAMAEARRAELWDREAAGIILSR
jgi:crotonobetaine/carnitine-CoA ligase